MNHFASNTRCTSNLIPGSAPTSSVLDQFQRKDPGRSKDGEQYGGISVESIYNSVLAHDELPVLLTPDLRNDASGAWELLDPKRGFEEPFCDQATVPRRIALNEQADGAKVLDSLGSPPDDGHSKMRRLASS